MIIIAWLLQLFVLLLFARAIFSWVRVGPDSPVRAVSDVVYRLTEPVLAPIRNVLPPLGGLDLSPLVLIVAIQIIRQAVL